MRWTHSCALNTKRSSRFQPGEGPSRGLLRDYKPSDGTFWGTSADTYAAVGAGLAAPGGVWAGHGGLAATGAAVREFDYKRL